MEMRRGFGRVRGSRIANEALDQWLLSKLCWKWRGETESLGVARFFFVDWVPTGVAKVEGHPNKSRL